VVSGFLERRDPPETELHAKIRHRFDFELDQKERELAQLRQDNKELKRELRRRRKNRHQNAKRAAKRRKG
jgi:hypothetical protein